MPAPFYPLDGAPVLVGDIARVKSRPTRLIEIAGTKYGHGTVMANIVEDFGNTMVKYRKYGANNLELVRRAKPEFPDFEPEEINKLFGGE